MSTIYFAECYISFIRILATCSPNSAILILSNIRACSKIDGLADKEQAVKAGRAMFRSVRPTCKARSSDACL